MEKNNLETDKDIIVKGENGWALCWICKEQFARKRETKLYCHHCLRGFCDGEHGNFRSQVALCVVCSAR